MSRLPFRLDSRDRKLLGVCAGISRSTGIDSTIVRIAWVAVPLLTFVTIWQAMLAYLICGIFGAASAARRHRGSRHESTGRPARTSIHEMRTSFDATDRRMMAIDHHLHSQESDALAREIEALRTEKA